MPSMEPSAVEPSETTPLLSQLASNRNPETQLSNANNDTKRVSPGRQIAPDLLRGLLMAFMAIDHTSVTVGGYAHGTGVAGEEASHVITEWNNNLAYLLRTLSHLCAPGFTMLLGMGIAFFTESRMAQGLKPNQFAKHFTLRALAILLVNTFTFGVALIQAPHIIINVVMWTLAIDYLIVGTLCVLLAFIVEPYLQAAIQKLLPSSTTNDSTDDTTRRASNIAFHIINAFLLIASISILWASIWASPNQGSCHSSVSITGWSPDTAHCKLNGAFLFDVLFHTVSCPNRHIYSNFPPIPWLPFALFGLLYGRLLIRGNFTSSLAVTGFNATLSVIFALLFVSTRLLSYGNLSTNCLSTPDQARQTGPSPNQYLASIKSFFYVTKYPPSPSFAFFTLSCCYLLLSLFSASSHLPQTSTIIRSRFNPLLVFGQQPLFFYGAHLLFLQIISAPILNSRWAHPLPAWSRAGKGVGLGWAFLIIYLLTLTVMYVCCWFYSRFKLRSGRESVWRFL